MTLSWLPPKDDGGSKITNYVIEKREANRRSWVPVTSEPKECIFTVPKLLEGHEYIFRIMAQNKYGIGEPLDSEPEIARNLFSKYTVIQLPASLPFVGDSGKTTVELSLECWTRVRRI